VERTVEHVMYDLGACRVLAIVGEFDVSTADELRAVLDDWRQVAQGSPAFLDLSGVRFIDSAALRAIVEAQRAWTKSARPFQLSGMREHIDRLIETIDVGHPV
jgi:anti-anti-sigma factor